MDHNSNQCEIFSCRQQIKIKDNCPSWPSIEDKRLQWSWSIWVCSHSNVPGQGKERPLPKKTVCRSISVVPGAGGRLLTMADWDTQMLDPVVHFCCFSYFILFLFFASSLSGNPIKQIVCYISNCTGCLKMAIDDIYMLYNETQLWALYYKKLLLFLYFL